MNACDLATPEHQRWINQRLAVTRANGGLAPVDLPTAADYALALAHRKSLAPE